MPTSPEKKSPRAFFRNLIRKYGWKMAALIFVGYLVRDLTLYVLIPFLIVKGLL